MTGWEDGNFSFAASIRHAGGLGSVAVPFITKVFPEN